MQIHRGQVSKPFPRQNRCCRKVGPVSTAYRPLNECLGTSPGVSDFLLIVLVGHVMNMNLKRKKRFIRLKLKLEFMVNIQTVTEPDQH